MEKVTSYFTGPVSEVLHTTPPEVIVRHKEAPPPRGEGGLQAPERCLKAVEVVFGRVGFLFAHLDVAQVERLVWSHTVVSSISPGSSRPFIHQHVLPSGPRKGPVCGSWLTLKATTRWISTGSNMMAMKGVKLGLRLSAGAEISGSSSDITWPPSLIWAFKTGSLPSWPRAQGLCKHQPA